MCIFQVQYIVHLVMLEYILLIGAAVMQCTAICQHNQQVTISSGLYKHFFNSDAYNVQQLSGVECVFSCLQKSREIQSAVFDKTEKICVCSKLTVTSGQADGAKMVYVVALPRRGVS